MLRFILLFVLICPLFVNAQVTTRYNIIQRPTETAATIAWRTVNPEIGTIMYGDDPFSLINVASNPTATTKHFFDLSGLTSNSKYFYQTSTDAGFLSAIDSFYTAKPDSLTDITFLHYGDCGYNNTIQNDIAALMLAENADFGVVAGDIDQGVGDDYENVFFGVYKDILKQSCHYTCIGNHDIIADNGDTYLDAFYLPTNNPTSTEEYYSFTWGNSKFVCLNSNADYSVGSDQYEWMLDEFKCNDRQWLYVFFHHPPWTNAWDALYYIPFQPYYLYEGNVDMRTDLVPAFESYGVDFVLNGHSHCYQRGEYNGVHYIISGGAGASTLDFNTNSNAPNIQNELYINQYVKFNIKGDTCYYVCKDENGVLVDSVGVIKPFVPIRPELSFDGTTLTSTAADSYEWYLDGVQIIGATSQTIVPTQSGVYQVITTNQYGCQFESDALSLNVAGLADLTFDQLSVYPNPFSDQITIAGSLGIDADADIEITVYNALGQKVANDLVTTNGSIYTTLDLRHIRTGIYVIELVSNGKRSTYRISKH
jgi:hypothetical protein